MSHARQDALSRRIAARVSMLLLALGAMLVQISSVGRPDLANDVGADIELVGSGAPVETTVGQIPASRPSFDADDDADDSSDDDYAPAPDCVRTLAFTAELSFAERVTTQTGPPPSMKLILVAPKNSPPTA